jgi:hypothetical protein
MTPASAGIASPAAVNSPSGGPAAAGGASVGQVSASLAGTETTQAGTGHRYTVTDPLTVAVIVLPLTLAILSVSWRLGSLLATTHRIAEALPNVCRAREVPPAAETPRPAAMPRLSCPSARNGGNAAVVGAVGLSLLTAGCAEARPAEAGYGGGDRRVRAAAELVDAAAFGGELRPACRAYGFPRSDRFAETDAAGRVWADASLDPVSLLAAVSHEMIHLRLRRDRPLSHALAPHGELFVREAVRVAALVGLPVRRITTDPTDGESHERPR